MKVTFCSLFVIVIGYTCLAQDRYIQVTTGGGVAGTATRHKMSLDGKVLKGKGLGEIKYTETGKLKKRTVKKYFKKSKALVESYPDFNHPGNVYFSILVYDRGKEIQMTWGDMEHQVPERAENLYKKINSSLTRLKFTPETHK